MLNQIIMEKSDNNNSKNIINMANEINKEEIIRGDPKLFNENELEQVKVDYIKSYLDAHLENMGIYKKLMDEFTKEDLNDEELIMKRIQEEGLVDNLVESISKWGVEEEEKKKNKDKSTQKGIFMKINSGSEFVDFVKQDPNTKLVIDVLFLGQRFKTKPIYVSDEMNIDQCFFMDFNPNKIDIQLDLENLLRLSTPIHLVLMTISKNDSGLNTRKLLATKSLEWRWALSFGTWKVQTEIYSSQSSLSKVKAGILGISLSLLPFVDKKKLLPETAVFNYINSEKKYSTQVQQDFLKYANEWWDDYTNINKSYGNRLIKLFLNTEDKENYAYKPASSLVFPITSARSLSSPYEAARFVSLIPYVQNIGLNKSKEEIFNSVHTLLSMKASDVEDHCILLCNILLGFGLDAYVAFGLTINGPHCWVITRGITEEVIPTTKTVNNSKQYETSKIYSITFWESLTGQRINITNPKVFRFYKKIHCVFSERSFYANIQTDDSVFNSSYVFENASYWKTIPSDKLDLIVKYDHTPSLDLTNIITDVHKMEIDLENEMKLKFIQFRRSLDISTQFDNKLSYLLSPALCNYELERVSCTTFGNEEFKQSIKNYVPEGYTFKAFPCHDVFADSNNFFSLCLSSDIGKDILYTRGDTIRFAVRCKIYQYPQDIMSCWLMIGVKFRPIK